MKKIFITGVGGICGGFDGDSSPDTIYQGVDGSNFMTLGEATKWLPIDLDFSIQFGQEDNSHKVSLEHLSDHIVCPVQMTDGELALRAGMKPMRRERHQFFAMIAAAQAMKDIRITEPEKYACIGATGGAGLLSNFQTTLKLIAGKKVSPFDNLKYLPNTFVGDLAQRYGLRGPSEVHGTACAASGDAFNSLVRMILLGEVDGGLLTGTDAAISEFGVTTFARQGALGNGHTFQSDRTGFAMGEGAGALFIESEISMNFGGRVPLAEIIGYASSSDANEEIAITSPDPFGQAIALRKALEMASTSLNEVELLSVHGTATDGDPKEIDGLELLRRTNLKTLKTIAPKTWIGHMLGAASVVETVMMVSQMRARKILPTRGLTRENLDPSCDRVAHVMQPSEVLSHDATAVLSSFGFAQTNAVRVLRNIT